MSIVAALFVPAVAAGAEVRAPRVGDTYEIIMTSESSDQRSDRSSASSQDKDTLIERVISVRADGLALEYDLPKSADDTAANWQFPVRIFRLTGGAAQLLNGPELEARVDGWLKAAGLARSACGHWIFTWKAFRIECDPQSVLKTVESFDLRSADLREGARYKDPEARDAATLARKAAGPDALIFSVEEQVDPKRFVVLAPKPMSLRVRSCASRSHSTQRFVNTRARSSPGRSRSYSKPIRLQMCAAERG